MSNSVRERLFDAASSLFQEHGYDVSIDMIISRAGVARQSFYNHFPTKEALFVEVMREWMKDVLVPLNQSSPDLRDTLLRFAAGYRAHALSPCGLAGYRTILGQVPRFPELTREVFESSIGSMLDLLVQVLADAMRKQQLRSVDPVFAAEMLMSLLAGYERSRLLFGVGEPCPDEERRVGEIVDGYMRMFAPLNT